MLVVVQEGTARLEVQGQEDRFDLNSIHVSYEGTLKIVHADHTCWVVVIVGARRVAREIVWVRRSSTSVIVVVIVVSIVIAATSTSRSIIKAASSIKSLGRAASIAWSIHDTVIITTTTIEASNNGSTKGVHFFLRLRLSSCKNPMRTHEVNGNEVLINSSPFYCEGHRIRTSQKKEEAPFSLSRSLSTLSPHTNHNGEISQRLSLIIADGLACVSKQCVVVT